jgi:hypothetical protein
MPPSSLPPPLLPRLQISADNSTSNSTSTSTSSPQPSQPPLDLQPPPPPLQPAQESPLPGIKRGIAIGVAVSLTLLLIAVLGYAVVVHRRRRRRRARDQRRDWGNEKELPTETGFGRWGKWGTGGVVDCGSVGGGRWCGARVETDARSIHELDAGVVEVVELPCEAEVGVVELDAGDVGVRESGIGEFRETGGVGEIRQEVDEMEARESSQDTRMRARHDMNTTHPDQNQGRPLEREEQNPMPRIQRQLSLNTSTSSPSSPPSGIVRETPTLALDPTLDATSPPPSPSPSFSPCSVSPLTRLARGEVGLRFSSASAAVSPLDEVFLSPGMRGRGSGLLGRGIEGA